MCELKCAQYFKWKKKQFKLYSLTALCQKNDISNFNETHLLKYHVTGMNMYIIQIMKNESIHKICFSI